MRPSFGNTRGNCMSMANIDLTDSSGLAAAAVDDLRTRLLGAAIEPGDPVYDSARAVWNAMIDRRPALIVRCSNTGDVIEAVRFARQRNRAIAIRGGGHNVAGHAVGEGSVMLDLSAMRAVRVDAHARRAWVQGGAVWRDVDAESQVFG